MNKKGFTLIELLAVIIILGILMIIAIPSVTRYISDSRKSSYVDTAKEIVGGARNLVNDGKLGMFDTNSTYYIPVDCIKTENALKSPYGDFEKDGAYVGVIYDGKGYQYYWISVDDAGQGVKNITRVDKLDTDDIESDLKKSDITDVIETTGIGNRTQINILNCSNDTWTPIMLSNTSNNVSEEGGPKTGPIPHSCGNHCVCKRATSLHTTTCNSESVYLGCKHSGYYSEGDKGTSTITYGNVDTTPGVLKSGDAFDCKVKEDGDFTERFYYITTNGNEAVLLYYSNVSYGTPNTYTYSPYYSGGNEGWHGPRDAKYHLPTTTYWNYVGENKIKAQTTRAITTNKNNTSVNGKQLPTDFSYSGYSARLLTTQELGRACGITVGNKTFGELDSCNYVMENTQYDDVSKIKGYWLENADDDNDTYACAVICNIKNANVSITNRYSEIGVRPAIDVSIDNIEY